MSELMSSISGLFSQILTPETTALSVDGMHHHDDIMVSLNSFRPGFMRCQSDHESSLYVTNHVKYLKWQLTGTQLMDEQISLLLQRCTVCKSLGHDVSFAQIHAMKLAQSAKVWRHKLIAYNCCLELLTEGSEMSILMVSTLYRDVSSRHVPTILLALTAIGKLISSDFIPSIDQPVTERLKHPSPLVRHRVVVCLAAFAQKNPELVEGKLPYFKAALLDKHPKVMLMAVQAYHTLPTSALPDDLIKPLLFILSQLMSLLTPNKISNSRGGVCGPNQLVRLIRLISRVGKGREDWRQKIELSLLSVMDKFENTPNIFIAAVVTECCLVLPTFTANSHHLDRIVRFAEKLLKSKWSNYKYVGLRILMQMVNIEKSLITPYQGLIVSCLNSSDATLCSKSMELVIKLATTANIQSVYDLYAKMVKSSSDLSTVQRQGLEILSCLSLNCIDIDWFSQRLLHLLMLIPIAHHQLQSLLSYLSQPEASTVAVKFYTSFSKELETSESLNLDPLCILLWTHLTHTKHFEANDPKIIKLLSTKCKSLDGDNGISVLLTLIVSSIRNKSMELKEADLEVIRDLVSRCHADHKAFLLFRDLCGLVCKSSSSHSEHSTELSDEVWRHMEKYTKTKLESNKCRPAEISTGASSMSALKFTRHADSLAKPEQGTESITLKPSRTVWTSKGRISQDSMKSDVSELSSNSAPVEFDIEEDGEDTTSQIASDIFSNI